jgi:hypothetical protein
MDVLVVARSHAIQPTYPSFIYALPNQVVSFAEVVRARGVAAVGMLAREAPNFLRLHPHL